MLAVIKEGDVKELAEVMRQDPGFKVNMDQNGDGWTLLHYACHEDSRSPVIPLLLAHPDVDVNVKNKGGATPFFLACFKGRPSCAREMLKDSRVKVYEPRNYGETPLWWAAYWGHLDVIKCWIASGREMDLAKPGVVISEAIGAAKMNGKKEVASLLERFKKDAAKTRSEVRKELGINS